MWSMFIFHGQVLSTVCPCKIARKPPQSQLHPCGVFIKNLTPPQQVQGPPLQGNDFCGIHSPPTRFKMLSHCSKLARQSEVSTASQDTAFTAYFTQISPHLHPHNLDGTPVNLGPLWGLHTFKRASCMLSLYFSQWGPIMLPQASSPLLCPRGTEAKLQRLPLPSAQTTYPSWPTPSECMVDKSWTQSHWRSLEDTLPGP